MQEVLHFQTATLRMMYRIIADVSPTLFLCPDDDMTRIASVHMLTLVSRRIGAAAERIEGASA